MSMPSSVVRGRSRLAHRDVVSAGVGDYRAIIKSNEEKMEQQQKLIMNLHSVIQTLQDTIESLNKKLDKFETPKGTGAKEKGAAATLVEPNNAHEGWTEVGLKKSRRPSNSQRTKGNKTMKRRKCRSLRCDCPRRWC